VLPRRQEYAPHYIATYLIEALCSFNNFYAHEQVIGTGLRLLTALAIARLLLMSLKNG